MLLPALHELAPVLETFGYNPIQSRFLTLVILHTGVFLRRQYCTFGQGRRGSLDHVFIRKLLASRHATASPYYASERLYHVHAKPLYAALHRPDDSHRRRANAALCAQRLLTLDYVLTAPEQPYLTSEGDKAALFTELDVSRDVWPARTFRGRASSADTTTRYFPEKFPLYHSPTDGTVFLFPHAIPGTATEALDTFLARYLPLFRALPRVMLRYLHPAGLPPEQTLRTLARFQRDPDRRLPELRRSLRRTFSVRERLESRHTHGLTLADLDQHRLDQARFHGAPYEQTYAAWRRLSPENRYRALVDLNALPAAREVVPLRQFSFCAHTVPYRYAFRRAQFTAPTRESRCPSPRQGVFS
ncbi:MAG: hypothetical protein GEU99_23470 [Luteitalea sp.]|nr:hypothetical protein [Luteitalea sp.]